MVAFIFQRKGSSSLSVDDFIYGPAADLGWFSSKEMRKVLENAEKQGFVIVKDKNVVANFDYSAVNIPLGFKPTKDILERVEERPLFQRLLEEITAISEKNKQEILALANKKQDSMNLEIEVALLLVAREMGLELHNKDIFMEEVEALILGEK